MSTHQQIEKVLHKTRHKLLEFSNAGGNDSQIANMNNSLAEANNAVLANQIAIANWEDGYQDRCRLAWEDSESALRKGTFTNYINVCVKPNDDACWDKNQSLYKDRYQRRYTECMTKYNSYLNEKAKAAGLAQDVQDIQDQIDSYLANLNSSVANGLSLEQAEALANAELAKLQAAQEAERLLREQMENARNSDKFSPYTKYIVIGGFLVAAVAMVLIFKKK
tara:strand:- start:5064 stop:5729 length:666 start_codon:yes stop_codon:yes gene_type:complete